MEEPNLKDVISKVNCFKFNELIKDLQDLILTYLNIYRITLFSRMNKEFLEKFNYIDNFRPTAIRLLDGNLFDNCEICDRLFFKLPNMVKKRMFSNLEVIEINFRLSDLNFSINQPYSLKLRKLIITWIKQPRAYYEVNKIFPNVEEFEEAFYPSATERGIKFKCAIDLLNVMSLTKYPRYSVSVNKKINLIAPSESNYNSTQIIDLLDKGDKVIPGINEQMKTINIHYMNLYLYDTIDSILKLFPNLEEIKDSVSHWIRQAYVNIFNEKVFTSWTIERNIITQSKRKFHTIAELKEYENDPLCLKLV